MSASTSTHITAPSPLSSSITPEWTVTGLEDDVRNVRLASTATTPAATRPSSPIPAALPASPLPSGKHKVAIIGSGSWGTALAKIAAENVLKREGEFDSEVRMWVREKQVKGRNLTEVINETNENERYLPGIKLPKNLRAVGNLKKVVEGASLLVFVVPHQFLHTVIREFQHPGVIAPGAIAISAIKGVEVNGSDIQTFASLIEGKLGIQCSALGGANVALEVAKEQYCGTTVGCPTVADSLLWLAVFDSKNFKTDAVEDVSGVSLAGALKNVVALAAGFVDGLGLGGNTKASIMLAGQREMTAFAMEFFPGCLAATFERESCGIADLITTCYSGRNAKCAREFVKTNESFEQLETRLLKGQKLQGVATAEEVHDFLVARKRQHGYPLFEKVYQIAMGQLPPKEIVNL